MFVNRIILILIFSFMKFCLRLNFILTSVFICTESYHRYGRLTAMPLILICEIIVYIRNMYSCE